MHIAHARNPIAVRARFCVLEYMENACVCVCASIRLRSIPLPRNGLSTEIVCFFFHFSFSLDLSMPCVCSVSFQFLFSCSSKSKQTAESNVYEWKNEWANEGTGKCLPFFFFFRKSHAAIYWVAAGYMENAVLAVNRFWSCFFFLRERPRHGKWRVHFILSACIRAVARESSVRRNGSECMHSEWRLEAGRERQQKSNQTGRCCAARCWIAAAVVYEVTAQT